MPNNSDVILCGRCIVQPDVPEGPKPSDMVNCPICGASDTVERVLSQARHHATHQAARDLDARRLRRGSRLTSFTPTKAPIKSAQWITGQPINSAQSNEGKQSA